MDIPYLKMVSRHIDISGTVQLAGGNPVCDAGQVFSGSVMGLGSCCGCCDCLGKMGLKWFLPEKDIRLELLFLSNALIAVLGIIATVNGKTAVAGNSEVDWIALGGVMAFVAAGLLCGCVAYKIKLKKTIKNK